MVRTTGLMLGQHQEMKYMSQKTKINRSRRFNFREAILHALAQKANPMTPRLLMVRILSDYYLATQPSPKILNNMLQKLSRKGLLEFVYLDNNYGVKITQKGLGTLETISLTHDNN